MKNPYIGITGFMSLVDAQRVLETISIDTERLLMIGVLASLKTVKGIQNKWPNRYPSMAAIAGIFPEHPLALNLIHYSTKEVDTLVEQLIAMADFGGVNLHGFQLNVIWPAPAILRAYRKQEATKQIVLQIGSRAFELVNHSPEQLAAKVAEYEGLVEYVLLDQSGGYGSLIDPERASDYLRALKANSLSMSLGIAGGLSPDAISVIEPLAKEFPNLSIDAEGRLRTAEGHLDLELASQYVSKALAIFGSIL